MKHLKKFNRFINESNVSESDIIGLTVNSLSDINNGVFEINTGKGILCFGCGGGASVDVEGNTDLENIKISNITIDEYSCNITFDNGEVISIEDDTHGEGLEIWWKDVDLLE